MGEKKVLEILNSIRPEYNFEESSDFIEDGLLDSFDMVTLVSELEESFNIVIDGLDIVPENFNTVQSIVSVIKKNGGII